MSDVGSESSSVLYPVISVTSPLLVLFVIGLSLANYFYNTYYLRTVQVMLSTSAEERAQYSQLTEEYRALSAEAASLAKNSSTFAQHSQCKRKMKPLEDAITRCAPVLRGGPPTASATTLSKMPVYIGLALATGLAWMYPFFELVENPSSPKTDCIEATFYSIFWALGSDPAATNPLQFSFASLTDTLANNVASCIPTRYIFVQNFLTAVILYQFVNSAIAFTEDVLKKVHKEEEIKFF